MTIAEISKKFDLSPDTLRYYERIGLIRSINRNKSGIRDYTAEDCKWIEFVKCMRNAGLPIEVLIEYLELFHQGDSTAEARKALLIEQRDQLIVKMEEIKQTISRLNIKIERYEQTLGKREKELLGSIDPDLKT